MARGHGARTASVMSHTSRHHVVVRAFRRHGSTLARPKAGPTGGGRSATKYASPQCSPLRQAETCDWPGPSGPGPRPWILAPRGWLPRDRYAFVVCPLPG
eukprot:14076406-Alexandrium_andersonii.AAC.1